MDDSYARIASSVAPLLGQDMSQDPMCVDKMSVATRGIFAIQAISDSPFFLSAAIRPRPKCA
jgi:hypothetical protein